MARDDFRTKPFTALEKKCRSLISEMRNDLANKPLVREFILLSRGVIYNRGPNSPPLFVYYYEDHEYLRSLMTIMQHAGAIYDVAFNDVPRYNFTEEFVSYLIGDKGHDINSDPASSPVEESEWQPIPVDRDDPALQRADKAIKDVIEAAEGDNGYAVHAPDERDYVISNLKSFRTLVQEQKTIYALQIKTFVLDPLGRVVARFGKATLGLAAEAAKKAVVDWIKSHFGKVFDWLF